MKRRFSRMAAIILLVGLLSIQTAAQPEIPAGAYTIAVLPDTQYLLAYWPDAYLEQMRWVTEQKEEYDIRALLHMGDMINENTQAQWSACKAGTDLLDTAGIPWMPMMGNHEDSAWFNTYYDYETYGAGRPWFGGAYHRDKLDHTYWFVNTPDREFLILSLGWAPSWDVLAWAEGVVASHPQKDVILTSHALLNADGTLQKAGDPLTPSHYYPGCPNGVDIWEAMKQYPNIVLVLCGHIHSADVVAGRLQNAAGREVPALLVNCQDDDISAPNAMVALLTFHVGSDRVDIRFYSATQDELCQQASIRVPAVDPPGKTVPMYRLYNPNTGEHFYTGSGEERENLVAAGWQYEGVAWNAPIHSGEPVYRLYNPNTGDHHYTMSIEERDMLVAAGWQYEAVAWNSAGGQNLPMYRLYNPNALCGSHHYTGSTQERDYLVSLGWSYEGIAWFGLEK